MSASRDNPDKPATDASAMFQEHLKSMSKEANSNVTHAEFVTGIQNRTIGVKFLGSEPYLVTGVRRAVFNILVMLYMVGPLVVIPLWAYIERNWLLLAGVVVSYSASVIAPFFIGRKGNSVGGFLLFACIVFWCFKGTHNYYTFFALCALWGYMFYHIAEEAQREYAMKALLESSGIYEEAVAHNMIMIVRQNTVSAG